MSEFWESAKQFVPVWIATVVAACLVILGRYGEAKDLAEIWGRKISVPPQWFFWIVAVLIFVGASFWSFHQVRMERDEALGRLDRPSPKMTCFLDELQNPEKLSFAIRNIGPVKAVSVSIDHFTVNVLAETGAEAGGSAPMVPRFRAGKRWMFKKSIEPNEEMEKPISRPSMPELPDRREYAALMVFNIEFHRETDMVRLEHQCIFAAQNGEIKSEQDFYRGIKKLDVVVRMWIAIDRFSSQLSTAPVGPKP